MSFINKSANYSQTFLLKRNILQPILLAVNNFVSNIETPLSVDRDIYYAPNNNNKYYCLITKKSNFEKTVNTNYNIAYLFSTHEKPDYYFEMDSAITQDCLLEGYLYVNDSCLEFLAIDILHDGQGVVDASYTLRYNYLNELLYFHLSDLKRINNNVTLGIHPIVHEHNKNIIKIMQTNFKYATDITAIEKIDHYCKENIISNKEKNTTDPCNKIVSKTNLADVYNVMDCKTQENNGILYVKGVKQSKLLKQLVKDTVEIQCVFNTLFNKWEPLI
jgi:hypothetical protein